jgi:hypothetical protein
MSKYRNYGKQLKINKSLPYIKLPKEKVDLFIDWYNQDLRAIKEMPEVFSRGYLEIDTSTIFKYQTYSIFDLKTEEELQQLKAICNKLDSTYNKMILYFNYTNDLIRGDEFSKEDIDNQPKGRRIDIEGYCNTGELVCKQSLSVNKDDLTDKIRAFIMLDKNITYPQVPYTVSLNLLAKDITEVEQNQNEFNRKFINVCTALFTAVIWYLATNKTEKYIVDETTQIIEAKHHTNKNHKSHNRAIKTPIYELVDRRQPTIKELVGQYHTLSKLGDITDIIKMVKLYLLNHIQKVKS